MKLYHWTEDNNKCMKISTTMKPQPFNVWNCDRIMTVDNLLNSPYYDHHDSINLYADVTIKKPTFKRRTVASSGDGASSNKLLRHMFNDKEFTDFTVKVGDRVFK